MKRSFYLLAALACFMTPVASSHAQQDIPVQRVVLSTSGLAYFEHGASVSGAETLSFPVRVDQVNDLLKSLLVFDPEGSLRSVTLPGQKPLEQVFRDLPFTQGDLNHPVSLLNAYQGAEVKITDSGQSYSGLLIQIVPETEQVDERSMTRHRISLLTESGLKSFIFEDVQTVALSDEKDRSEIQTALNAVRENGEAGQRQLRINLAGDSNRAVTLSYVVEAPLWKTAYRAVLPDQKSGNGHLQGWAVIENMTGGDWRDVQLTLTSGNPVTMQQALYPSYYVSRPEIPVEVFGRVMPRQDTGAMDLDTRETASQFSDRRRQETTQADSFSGGMAKSMAMPEMAAAPVSSRANMAQAQQIAKSTEATAQIVFKFPGRFDLDSGKTMMLPFIDREINMETVALYQPDVEPEHPFLSVFLTNEGETSLPPGILTLYEEGAGENAEDGLRFVGDARLDLLPKGDKRMISYALDNKTRIDREFKHNQFRHKMTASEGVLRTSVQYREETVYTIDAPAEEKRVVIIEHPRKANYELTGADKDDVEITPTHYRIRVAVAADETVTRKIILERTGWESIRIENINLNQLRAYASADGKLDSKTRSVFEDLAKHRQAMAAVKQQINDLEAKRQEIYKDQQRLRQNIQSLSGNSDLRDRYLERMNDQEDSLEDIAEDLDDLNKAYQEKRNDLQQYIRGIKF